jgi:OFA family oxalate/formate antiporter-like MFS transporter
MANPMTSAGPVMNRWLVVIGAILIQLCLGAIYAWSVFTPPLKAAPFNFSATQTQIIFSVGLATFAIVMILAGRWQASVGPTLVARLGGIVLGVGYVLGGIAAGTLEATSAFWAILVTVGLIGGAGIGLAYVVPIAVGVKWFPDKKGMITGLAVAGFGFGALIWIYLGQGLPEWTGIQTTGLIESLGVANVFLTFGIAFLVLVLIGSIWMKNPPEGWLPAGWTPSAGSGTSGTTGADRQLQPREMLRTPQFYMLWVMFIFGALAGLMVIGIIKLFGIDALQAKGMDAEKASITAGTAMALFYALANGLGRIVWGTASDRLGRKLSLILMMGIQGIVMLVFFHMGGSPALLFLGAALIGFNFGGNFALFPAATADFFGNKNVGANYGWMFTAYGVGGIVGPIMAGLFKDVGAEKGVDAWFPAFVIAGIACLLAAAIGLTLRPPKPRTITG